MPGVQGMDDMGDAADREFDDDTSDPARARAPRKRKSAS
jgi:hypothetical protein